MPTKNPAAVALGKLGGMKTKASMPKDHYSTIGKKAMEKRWGKKNVDKVEKSDNQAS